MTLYKMRTTSEDPTIAIRWADRTDAAVPLSAATFEARFVNRRTKALTATLTTVTGYATFQGTTPDDYNALITFATGALATIGAGLFDVEVDAVVSGRSRPFGGEIVVEITAPTI